jgi:hypothetical protein
MNRTLVTLGILAGIVAGCAGRGKMARPIEDVLAAHVDSLMAVPGVVGTAIGRCDGALCIRVFLSGTTDAARERIPARLEGYVVRVEVTGPISPR